MSRSIVFITARMVSIFVSSTAVHMYDFIYLQSLFTTWRVHLNQRDDQLPIGLLPHLVEHCTSIAEVMG